MNLNQVLLVVFALTMLGMLQLSINTSILQSIAMSLDSGARMEALIIGRSMADEIVNKNFDRVTASKAITNRSELTAYNSFGPDSGETVILPDSIQRAKTFYNDVDDYHRYQTIVKSPNLGRFSIRDSVIYVREDNLEQISATPTWYKKIIVTISHPNLLQPVVVQSLAVYPKYF